MAIQGQSSTDATAVVQSIWLGPLSVMERLVIASFGANGHEFHLYTYDQLDDLPGGAVLKDAREVLPANWVLRDSRGSFAGFSDVFRYKLLLEKGGWWVDMDTVCLQPWRLTNEYFFVREPDLTISAGVIHAPPGSDVMRRGWERSQAYRPRRLPFLRKRLPWMALGPNLLGELVEACGLAGHAVDPAAYYPLDWSEWEELVKPDGVTRINEETKAVHLWNSMWALAGRDKDATYPHDCLYEQLKRRYLDAGRKRGTRMETLPNQALDKIRRSRRHPRPTQYDYLHLRRLLDDLATAFGDLDQPISDVLDVWCGTRPYEDLLPPGAQVVGLDIDNRFGAADVVSDEFLPFDDESFDLVICIEAFYYVADPEQAASEMRRVLRPGGTVLIAVPYVWEYDRTILEHRWTGPELQAVFAGWEHARVVENGGRGVTWATLTGRVIQLRQKFLPGWLRTLTRPIFAGAYAAVNAIGALIERGERRRASDPIRLPMNLMLIARRPG